MRSTIPVICRTFWEWCIWLLIVNIWLFSDGVQPWTTDISPKILIKYDHKRPVFFGNQSDYFQILGQDNDSLLIGARNAMYNVSLKNLLENQPHRLEWKSSDAHRELCGLKGKQESDCQNYIRVFARINDHKVMICGTNSYKPLCRYYKNDVDIMTNDVESTSNNANGSDSDTLADEFASADGSSKEVYRLINEIDGQGRCQYNPVHNSSYIFTDGQLYSATAADFSGGDALIYRETQRTEQFNAKQLNQPSFVSSVERNGYVFFFFRETAAENCGKTIYSRVARVCKNDKGGPPPFRERWTSYLKTRLNCSTPGDFPFYFDELQGTTGIMEGLYQEYLNAKSKIVDTNGTSKATEPKLVPGSIIYAVFTTPQNAIPGSAVCAFQMDDIIESFEGNFRGQKDSTSNWLPIPSSEVPEPRPGKCVDNSRELPMQTVNFVKTHALMATAVPALYGRPLLTRVTSKHRFTSITIDTQVESLNGDRYDVLFVGTDNGRIIKFINYLSTVPPTNDSTSNPNAPNAEPKPPTLETVVITETQALPHNLPVKQITVARDQNAVIVIGNGHVVSIPLNHCSHIARCRDCLNLQDPYCVWDTQNHECTSIASLTANNRQNFIQNIRQARKNSTSTIEMCKQSGDDKDNWINDVTVPQLTTKADASASNNGRHGSADTDNAKANGAHQSNGSTRGTVSSIGRIAPTYSGNEINPKTVNSIENGIDIEEGGELGVVVQRNLDAQMGIPNENDKATLAHPILASVIFIVFAVGLAIGFIISRRFKFSHTPFDMLCNGSGSGGPHHHLSEHHRNQLNYYDKSSGRSTTNGKDINLLMNVMGPYIAAGGANNVIGRTSLTNAQAPNNLNKKDILELDFETKDRSHEFRNSTEHLDINDLKSNTNNNLNASCNNDAATTPVIVSTGNTGNTGTLQKVKKTYL